MKGLLIKDLKLSFANKRLFYILIAVLILIVTCADESGIDFIVYFVTAMCLMMVISTISYDDYDNGMAFLMTLPICSKLYATEKYVFALLSGLSGFLVSLGGSVFYNIVTGRGSITMEFLGGASLVCAVYMCAVSFMLPIILKFGENGRIVALMIMGIVFAGFTVLDHILDFESNYAVIQKMNGMSETMIVIFAYVVTIIVMVISWLISVRIMEKKEI